MDICPYSGLPYTCALCPEDESPCYEKTKLKESDNAEQSEQKECKSE